VHDRASHFAVEPRNARGHVLGRSATVPA
jgi:hypothetical protein